MFRLTTYENGKKEVIAEEINFSSIESWVEDVMGDLESEVITGFTVSKITGRTGIRDDL